MDGRDGDTAAEWTRARELLGQARRITALTGAGVSTSSGIPDFRGPAGVWTRNPSAQRLVDYDSYLADPEVRQASWQARMEHPAWEAEPNAAHRALAELAGDGRLRTLVTQNIDGLHQRAGVPRGQVVELHGSMFCTVCVHCETVGSMRTALRRVREGEPDPECLYCGGIMKSATVLFGQQLDPDVLRRAREAMLNCDLLLAVGSSLTVQPAAGLVELAARGGADVVIANDDATPYDELAGAVLRDPLVEVLPALAAVGGDGGDQPCTWGDPTTWS